MARWDSDAVSGARAHARVAESFGSGEADVLVGTQMVTKGLHFPSVTLVGVVSADVGLNVPDFRAGERAFQLLCQVAGRAGRGENPGTVIVQTYQPDNYAVSAAAAQDYQRFYRQEMAHRYAQANPPYTKLIRLVYSHLNAQTAEGAARRSRARSGSSARRGASRTWSLGPTPAYPARVRARYAGSCCFAARSRAACSTPWPSNGWTVGRRSTARARSELSSARRGADSTTWSDCWEQGPTHPPSRPAYPAQHPPGCGRATAGSFRLDRTAPLSIAEVAYRRLRQRSHPGLRRRLR